MNIVAPAREDAMRANLDLDQRIARLTATDSRPAFAAQAKNLAVAGAGRNVDIEGRAVRECDLPLAAVDRVEEVQRKPIVHVGAAHAYAAVAAENLQRISSLAAKSAKPASSV